MRTRLPMARLGIILLSVCLLSPSLISCNFFFSAPQNSSPPASSYVSPLDWEQLIQDENGRFQYFRDGEVQSRFGVDVSEHQGSIDWQAAHDDGVEFAMIRLGNRGATEGQLYLDPYFEANIQGAQEAGIAVGVYFFSQAINAGEAREEAQFVLQNLNGRALDYPVAFDHETVAGLEGRANQLTDAEISRCAEAFFEVIRAAGYKTMLYGNKKDLGRLDASLLNSHAIWFAEYDSPHPTLEHDLVMWQYSSQGSVAGISTQTDLNILFLPQKESAQATPETDSTQPIP